MTEVRYMISDVSRILDMPTNVLRYLEYCLSLNIKRTELGYRYYLQEDIDLLGNVRILREKGFHMKVIKSILPYIDKVKALDARRLYELRERLEAALGLSGLEARESLKAQYGKVIDINMEEGDFIYKDPTTKQMTRLGSVTIKTEEVNTQPIDLGVDNNKSCEEVAATDVVIKESHMVEETANPSDDVKLWKAEETIHNNEMDSLEATKSRRKKDKKVTQIYDIKQAKSDYYMGAKKNHKTALSEKNEDQLGLSVEEFPARNNKKPSIKKEEIENRMATNVEKPMSPNVESISFNVESVSTNVDSISSNAESISSNREESMLSKVEQPQTGKSVSPHVEKKVESLSSRSSENLATGTEKRKDEVRPEEKKLCTTQESLLKDDQDKIVQFRQIMCSIVMDALRQNNHTLTNEINNTVTQSIVKEMDYMMRVREERQEERFRQLDRTIRETQIQRQQAAATKEGKKKPSKFFRKNKVRI